MRDLIEALTIFLKYSEEKWPTHCEHDAFMVACVDRHAVSDDDKKRLKELSFDWSDEYDCWVSFRFGSC